jgi:hypothetical protein
MFFGANTQNLQPYWLPKQTPKKIGNQSGAKAEQNPNQNVQKCTSYTKTIKVIPQKPTTTNSKKSEPAGFCYDKILILS